jgi:hypothetical protein
VGPVEVKWKWQALDLCHVGWYQGFKIPEKNVIFAVKSCSFSNFNEGLPVIFLRN